MTVSPSSLAHCVTIRPTPPAAACTRIVSPAFSVGQMRRSRYAEVSPRIVIAAAVSNAIVSGNLISEPTGMTRSVLYAPSGLPV